MSRRSHGPPYAGMALGITSQSWDCLGLGEDPNVSASNDLNETVDRITALLLIRIIAWIEPRGKYHDYSTTTICREALIKNRPWPSAITPSVLAQLKQFVHNIVSGYQQVPYHNFEHGYHVVISLNKLLDMMLCTQDMPEKDRPYTFGLKDDPLMLLALIFAALIHDVEHEGIPNRQLANENDFLAIQYNDQSIAENRSLYVGFSELLKKDYRQLREVIFPETEDYRRFRKAVINLVLTTDLASPERTQIGKSKWKEAFGDTYETVERKIFKQLEKQQSQKSGMLTAPSNLAMTPPIQSKRISISTLMSELSLERPGDSAEEVLEDDESVSATPETSEDEKQQDGEGYAMNDTDHAVKGIYPLRSMTRGTNNNNYYPPSLPDVITPEHSGGTSMPVALPPRQFQPPLFRPPIASAKTSSKRRANHKKRSKSPAHSNLPQPPLPLPEHQTSPTGSKGLGAFLQKTKSAFSPGNPRRRKKSGQQQQQQPKQQQPKQQQQPQQQQQEQQRQQSPQEQQKLQQQYPLQFSPQFQPLQQQQREAFRYQNSASPEALLTPTRAFSAPADPQIGSSTGLIKSGLDVSMHPNSNLSTASAMSRKFHRRLSSVGAPVSPGVAAFPMVLTKGRYQRHHRLGLLRTVDLSGEAITTYEKSLQPRQSATGSDGTPSKPSSRRVELPPAEEVDELRETVVMEQLLKAADVAHNLQGWDLMVKWSERLFMELRRAFVQGRGDDPQHGWYKNQIGFLEAYLLPLARRLDDIGVFGDKVGAMFAQVVETNRDRWLVDGKAMTSSVIYEGSQRFPQQHPSTRRMS